MHVYLSVMLRAGGEWPIEGLNSLLGAHAFRQSDVKVGSWVTYASRRSVDELHRFIEIFFAWLDGRPGKPALTWSILASDRPLANDWRPGHLPEWTLIEFFHSVLVDDEPFIQLTKVAPELASRFSWNEPFQLHILRRSPELHSPVAPPPPTAPAEPVAVPLASFSSGPDAGAQVTTVEASGFAQLLELARDAYRDVRTQSAPAVGGLNAVVLLSAERNGLRTGNEPQGAFSLYNLAALGLRYSTDPQSLSNLIANDSIAVRHITAEPRDGTDEEGTNGVSRSS